MQQYNVTGMTCAACSNRVEKAVSAVPGVTSCAVSLLTNSMGVEGTASSRDIIAAVEKAGYGASLKGAEKSSSPAADEEALADRETPLLRRGFLLLEYSYPEGPLLSALNVFSSQVRPGRGAPKGPGQARVRRYHMIVQNSIITPAHTLVKKH